jgi:bidirectional [NiFe] hydrogenase diaphorase subunit
MIAVSRTGRPATPSDDKRWRIIDATMRRHGYRGDALIESLHTAQECFGFLEEQGLRFIAGSLHVPLSKAYGVATFYHFFSLRPPGEHTCVVCTGTACYIKGAAALLQALASSRGVREGQTSGDGKLSVVAARCLGSCGLAPAAVFDGEVVGRLDAGRLLERVGRWYANDPR